VQATTAGMSTLAMTSNDHQGPSSHLGGRHCGFALGHAGHFADFGCNSGSRTSCGRSKRNNRRRSNSGNRLSSATSRDPYNGRAELTESMIEYNPQPPFVTGSPSKAGPQLTEQANELLDLTLEPDGRVHG